MALTDTLEELFDDAVEWSFRRPLSLPLRYLATAFAICTVAVYRAAFVTGLLPWLVFLPAILGSALLFGRGPDYFAVLLSAFLAGLSIGSSDRVFWLTSEQWLASGLFVIVAIGIAALAAALRASLEKAALLNKRLAERETFLSSILAASTDCIKVVELDGSLSFMSEGGMKVMEIPDFNAIVGCSWPSFWEGEEHPKAVAAFAASREGQTIHFEGQAKTFGGADKWWNVSLSPILDSNGEVTRILSVSRDHTDLVKSRQQQELLNAELGHRLKNMLTIIQAIASQTFNTSRDLAEANRSFAARLIALGRATDVLTATTWGKAGFLEVIEAGLAAASGEHDRINIAGPIMELEPQIALALTMTLHEMTTNALKYGALNGDAGSVSIHWDVTGPKSERQFCFLWQERGGPVVIAPKRQGFGSRMIERSLRSYFKGTVRLSFEPTGVDLLIEAPLACVGRLTKAEI